jgi:hypothetical protein
MDIVPVVALCHFGVPDWIGNFQNPDFPELFGPPTGATKDTKNAKNTKNTKGVPWRLWHRAAVPRVHHRRWAKNTEISRRWSLSGVVDRPKRVAANVSRVDSSSCPSAFVFSTSPPRCPP